jgi:CheY-like chemotaxis protein
MLAQAERERRLVMTQSILDGKHILAVDDEVDILDVIGEEIRQACPNATIQKATDYASAAKLLEDNSYDLVILDIMGVRGFDLLRIAVKRGFKVAMLTAHALSPEALAKSHDLGARAYLPKDELGKLIPFLEDILKYEYKAGWKRLLARLDDFFSSQFEPKWKEEWGINRW